ncbi:MAG: hypothetical protein LRZ84_19880 [Desertifilum sp.]|nr:hypothetical protein [Desertifilum sp.]
MMNQPTFSKNLPAPLRMLIRPMLYFSIVLHGGFLLIPLPEPPPEVVEVEPEPVAVRPLSPSPPPPSPSPSPTPTPTPPPVQTPPSPVVTPPPTPVVQSPPQTPRRPSPPPPQPTPPPEIDPFLGAELFETPPPSPTPEVVQTPEPTPTPEVVQTPEPEPTPEVAELPEDPLAEFPHITGAQTGCEGQCWQIQQRSTSVARNLLESLEAQGFTIRRTDGDRTGERIYEVSKDGEVQYYISLFSTLDGGTKYAIADEPLKREDLANLNEEVSP